MTDSAGRPAAVVSVHDVMPETLGRVEAVLALAEGLGVPPPTLLVVPGRRWEDDPLRRLGRLAAAGYPLAAHGWSHRVECFGGFYHRLHGAVVSRDVAEHLALDGAGVCALMCRSYGWFAAHGLPSPTLYVPPAWALGPLAAAQRQRLPFAHIEVARGVVEVASGRLRPLPLAGFEADTPLRAAFLRSWNRAQVALAHRRPLRIGIHPRDLELPLSDQLRALLQRDFRFLSYDEAMAVVT
ncbi:MAG: polysaccharide deacetylase family protein [Gammaproteobacteria bacterium]|nr:polysaccharide deacetylase family protein [Gammaproteobacteria bacterium]